MKGILHTAFLSIVAPMAAFCQVINNDQCIGPSIGTGALFTQKTVGCVPFTVQIEKTDDISTDHQYIFNYTGGPPVNAVKEKRFTYTKPGAYKLMQVSFQKETGQELRSCATITVLDTVAITVNPKICNNTVSLTLSDIRKNGIISYDFCYIDWGDGSALEKINLSAAPVSHTYSSRTDKRIRVKGGYLAADCGGSNSIVLKFPLIYSPEIQEISKTGENSLALKFSNETGDDFSILADGHPLIFREGQFGQTQVAFENQKTDACYRVQLLNSCLSNPTSQEVCDIDFKLTATSGGNFLSWFRPSPEVVKDLKLFKNNMSKIDVTGTSYTDNSVKCNDETCYQIQLLSNGSLFTSQQLCVENRLIPCESALVIHVPTAFSPNNDGINDQLMLFGDLERFVSMKIFNRRGHVVKLINPPYTAWDGDDLPAGIYEYILRLKNLADQEVSVSGTITLLR